MKKHVGTHAELIEAATAKHNGDSLRLSSVGISDKDIAEMLRPKAIYEKDPRVMVLFRQLQKFGELPSPVIAKIMGVGTVKSTSDIVGKIVKEGYITVRRGHFNAYLCNLYALSPKGFAVLKKQK